MYEHIILNMRIYCTPHPSALSEIIIYYLDITIPTLYCIGAHNSRYLQIIIIILISVWRRERTTCHGNKLLPHMMYLCGIISIHPHLKAIKQFNSSTCTYLDEANILFTNIQLKKKRLHIYVSFYSHMCHACNKNITIVCVSHKQYLQNLTTFLQQKQIPIH